MGLVIFWQFIYIAHIHTINSGFSRWVGRVKSDHAFKKSFFQGKKQSVSCWLSILCQARCLIFSGSGNRMDVNRGPPCPTSLNSGLKIHPINHTHAAVHSTLTSGLGFGGGKNQGQDGILPKELTCVMHRFSVQQTLVAPYYQSNFIHTHTKPHLKVFFFL